MQIIARQEQDAAQPFESTLEISLNYETTQEIPLCFKDNATDIFMLKRLQVAAGPEWGADHTPGPRRPALWHHLLCVLQC